MISLSQDFYIYTSIFFVVLTVSLYILEKWSIVVKSIFILSTLLVFFSIFPLYDDSGKNLLPPSIILSGFSNTTLISVLSLLILGQGVVKTRVLDNFISNFIDIFPGNQKLIILLSLFFVLVLSGFLNNTPVVIIFIPIFQSIASKVGSPISRYMMPLSYVAILGGMTTLIGSSTNLLVANSLNEMKGIELGFFDFFIPGSVIALAGLIYVIFFSKYLLKNNTPMANELIGSSGKQFITQITVSNDSVLLNKEIQKSLLEDLKNVTILMVQRKEHAVIPPFSEFKLVAGDVLVVASTREALSELISKKNGISTSELSNMSNLGKENEDFDNNQILSEAMITPTSTLVGQTIENISFRYRFNCIVIGLQRKARMIRNRMTEIALEPGDILLIQSTKESIKNLRTHSDILPMEWSSTEIIKSDLALKSILIFLSVILLSIFEILPLVVSSLLGVFFMLLTKIISIRESFRAVDKNLLLIVVTSLALGNLISTTGTAQFISDIFFNLLEDTSPIILLSTFFILVSLLTNFISNNACAVLFTPIGLDLAEKAGIDPKLFAISIIFAVNTSFLTPMAYQTNLLVMGPGHYKFVDFIKFGLPLTLICWLTFTLFFPIYYNL